MNEKEYEKMFKESKEEYTRTLNSLIRDALINPEAKVIYLPISTMGAVVGLFHRLVNISIINLFFN